MKPLALLLLTVFIAAGCDAVSERAGDGAGLPLLSGTQSLALAGVVAVDSVTAEMRRLLDLTQDPVAVDHVSPDGRWAVGTDWSTGDIAMRDLAGDEIRNLTQVEDPWGARYEFGTAPLVSPHGDRVVFTWYQADGEGDRATLRTASLDGEEPEVEPFYVPSAGWPIPLGWSPDGEFLLVSHHAEDGTHELLLIPGDGGEPRLLSSLGWSAPQNGGFSPDGRWVAFDFTPDVDPPVRDIHVLSRDGERGGPVAAGPWNDYFLGWAPDGHILFLSDRGETRGVWRVAVEEGRAKGEPELVAPDVWRARGVGFDNQGRFYYNLISGTKDVHMATLDLEERRVVIPPAVAVPREIAGTRDPVWSPDGGRLAYVAERTPWGAGVLSDRTLMVFSLETGEVQRYSLPPRTHGERPQVWSADGRFLLLRASYDRAGPSLLRVDVQTGEVERFPVDGVDDSPAFHALPDGERVVTWGNVDSSDHGHPVGQVEVLDIRSGERHTAFEVAGRIPGRVVPSPDGERVAVVLVDESRGSRFTFWVHSLEDGEGRLVLEAHDELEDLRDLKWTADGSALLYIPRFSTERGEGVPVWRVMVRHDGPGEPHEVAVLPPGSGRLAPHPDGRRIAFEGGTVSWELWVMENIGPVVERTADLKR